MNETLILITGAYRLNNLVKIAKTINYRYNKFINKFDIRWLICKDQYNSIGNINDVINYLSITNINYKIIESGKSGQSNYGGDLFNNPLIQYIKQENLDNPWIYILDDDNILHPRLFEIFSTCIDNGFFDNKEIITTTNKWHCGHNREIDKNIFLLQNRNHWIQEWFLFDPSSVILKYSIIEKYGFFSNEFLYDFNWLNLNVLSHEYYNIIWFHDYDYSFGRHLVGTYHNGLVDKKEIDKFKDIDNLNIDIILYDNDVELPQMVPILSEESKQKIKDIIYEEINK